MSLNADTIEPLLDPKNERFTIFPILHEDLWQMFKTQQDAYWKAEEIDFSHDSDNYDTLTVDEQHFIKMVLAFFASADGIVNFNLRTRFMNEIKVTEALVVYSWQQMMENIHGEVYSQMLNNIIKNNEEREELFNAIKTVNSIKQMSDWAFKWIESDTSFAHRIVAFACVEGIFFSGSFCAIFWLKKYRSKGDTMMNGLISSNQFIARDEAMHCQFACMLYSKIINRLDEKIVHDIVHESVTISKVFVKEAIKCDMIGMNMELMHQYIEYVGDFLLVMLKYNKLYNRENPFLFMESIGLLNKTNFFESRPTEYRSAFATDNTKPTHISISEDFC